MFAWTMLGLLACLLSTSSSRTVGLPDKPDEVSLDRTIVLESNIDGKKIEFHHQTNNIPSKYTISRIIIFKVYLVANYIQQF